MASTWLRVTWRWSSRMSSPSPGTLPWTTATDRRPSVGTSYGASAGSHAGAQHDHSGSGGNDPRPAGRDDHPGEEAAEQREQEAEAALPDVRQRLLPRGLGGGEGEPAPGHAPERPGRPDRLDRRPRRTRSTAARSAAGRGRRPRRRGSRRRTPPAPTGRARRRYRRRASRTSGRSRSRCRRRGRGSSPRRAGRPRVTSTNPATAKRDQEGGTHRLERQGQEDARDEGGTGPEEHGGKGTCLQWYRKGPRSFGPTRDRLAAEIRKLSREPGTLPCSPSRSETDLREQCRTDGGAPSSDTATRTSVRRPRSAWANEGKFHRDHGCCQQPC